jgi:cobaltochelatase CobS
MALYTLEELTTKLWNLDTVTMRKVLRYLNNQARTIDPSTLASMRHEPALKHVMDKYPHIRIEEAFLAVTAEKPEAPPGPDVLIDSDPIIEEMPRPVPAPRRSKTEALEALLSDSITEERVNELIKTQLRGFVTETRLGSEIRDIKRVVNEVISEAVKNVAVKIQALEDALMASNSTSLTITFPDENRVAELGLVHRDTAKLIRFLSCGLSVFLTGPAGSGKSTGAEKAAQALNLPFYTISVCAQSTKTELLGYLDATGTYRRTQFRDAYENGGVYLIDEIDAGNPNVLAVLNNALSGSVCPFPDAMVKRHDNFRCIAAGNTWGTGKTLQYVGRNALDAATLNRFAIIYWDYDEALETKITGMPEWSKYVQACRREVKTRGVNMLITPRASIYGAKLLRGGVSVTDVMDTVLFPNIDPDLKRYMPPPPVISIPE